MTDIEANRAAERAKYEWLLEHRPGYGSTNHGAKHLGRVLASRPEFVVDLGCGDNAFARGIRLSGQARATGIDFANPGADIVAPMHRTTLGKHVADVVTAFDSLEHLLPEEVDDVLDEVARIAKPDARLFFTIATRPSRITAKGENLHPTVQPMGWWTDKVRRIAHGVTSHGSLVMGTVTGSQEEGHA